MEPVPAQRRGRDRAVHGERRDRRRGLPESWCASGKPALNLRLLRIAQAGGIMSSPRLPWLRVVQTSFATLLAVVAMSALGHAADPVSTARPVTFTKDVATILQNKCQQCHH